jgi:ATP-dependent Clp protease ATP-binding subunit ClpC
MFERYTESARRALFFARYEAVQLGAVAIETEHLLLGLTRESKGVVALILAQSHVSLEGVRAKIEGQSVFRERTSVSVEMPIGSQTQHVLRAAADEADALGRRYIGTEHLLLGLLREDQSLGASVLMEHGLRLDEARKAVAKFDAEPPISPSGPFRGADGSAQLAQILGLVDELTRMSSNAAEARMLAERIRVELLRLRPDLNE